MYSRAIIARVGLLALNRSETIYFSATKDSDGDILNDVCKYKVEGISPPARWWSITVYAEDRFLIPNSDKLYAQTASSLQVKKGDVFQFTLSPSKVADPWLPTKDSGNPNLIFRLYGPKGVARDNPEDLVLPTIIRGACI